MGSNLQDEPRQNWAGNYRYTAKHLYRPRTIDEVSALVANNEKVKGLGSRHCFNDIADSSLIQISTDYLDQFEIDEASKTVTLGSGLRYGQFCSVLDERGFALHNLASLPHISVAGACATATHGSGILNGNLGTAVSGLEFICGTGDLITLDRKHNSDMLDGAIANLGALGIVTRITLDVESSYSVAQNVFENLAFAALANNFDEIMSSGYSVSLFTDWQDNSFDQVWIKRRVDADARELGGEFFGATAATEMRHPLPGISPEQCTEQLGVAGPWNERLPHFRAGSTPSSGAELQSEYFVPTRNALAAVTALARIGAHIGPLLQVSEIRSVAADEQWLSPCYQQDSVAFHFTWKPDQAGVLDLLPLVEAELSTFDARPHWGKLFTMSPALLRSRYERMPDFLELLRSTDPMGKFRNSFLDRLFDGTS